MDIFRTKTTNEIRTKTMQVIPNNSEVWVVPLNSTHCGINYTAEKTVVKLRCQYTEAYKWLLDFQQPPSTDTLSTQIDNGYCNNPLGHKVESDGVDHFGFPSWCQILLGI